MAEQPIIGVNYFDHQFLRRADFDRARDYPVERQRQHARFLHRPGVLDGLAVTVNDAGDVRLAPGRAVDGAGHEVVLQQSPDQPVLVRVQSGPSEFREFPGDFRNGVLVLDLSVVPAATLTVFVTIARGAHLFEATTDVGLSGFTRFVERAVVEVRAEAPDAGSEGLLLATLNRNPGGQPFTRITPSGLLAGAVLADQSVTTDKIADLNVTTGKLAAGAVTTPKLDSAAVTTPKLADQNVTTDKLADLNVTTAKLAAGSVTTPKLDSAAVTTPKIADQNVTTDKIADLNVTTGKLADLGVTTGKLADLGVTTGKLAGGAVTTAKLDAGAVTTAKIADANVTTDKLADLGITTGKLADLAVTAGKLGANAVTAGKIAANAVTDTKLANDAVTGRAILAGTITADKLAPDVVVGVADGAVTHAKVAPGTVSVRQMASELVAEGLVTIRPEERVTIPPIPVNAGFILPNIYIDQVVGLDLVGGGGLAEARISWTEEYVVLYGSTAYDIWGDFGRQWTVVNQSPYTLDVGYRIYRIEEVNAPRRPPIVRL
jgi:hypothetical protein